MRPGRHMRRLALKAASPRHLHGLEARAGLALASAVQHIRRLRHPHLFSPRWKYTRLENDTIIRVKPRAILLSTLRSARRELKMLFLQAKYLIPPEAEAVGIWVV